MDQQNGKENYHNQSPTQSEVNQHNSNCSSPPICTSCHDLITESHLLKVDNRYWHEDCLRCNCCNCRLGEVGSSLYTRAELLLCKRDYLRMFGSIGYCNACEKVIPAFELVMRAGIFVYHLECFGCQECNHRFCVGDKCYLYGNRILCEADYEEIMLYNKIASQIPLSCTMMISDVAPTTQISGQNHHRHHISSTMSTNGSCGDDTFLQLQHQQQQQQQQSANDTTTVGGAIAVQED